MIGIKDMEMPQSCADCKLTYADVCPLLNKSIHREIINERKHKDCPLMEIQCNQCKHYQGVHNVQGHAPCDFWHCGGVLWNDYCSHFEKDN